MLHPAVIIDDDEALAVAMAAVASAMADPSRVKILCALMDGRAWTATELSGAADISPSTASAHLSRLVNSRLLICLAQGRHRYYRLAGGDVAGLLENMMTMAGKSAVPLATRTPGTLRMARTCYDHLAGEVAVAIYDFLQQQAWLTADGAALTAAGEANFARLGIACDSRSRRKACCACLDWSERRLHLGGAAGAALLQWGVKKGWFTLVPGYREVTISEPGKRAMRQHFGLAL
ncbi:ArsR/SmtB family transcription factor [Klebsiella aerogenes]|uniref:Winged helix-turn-helix transcriptional regulator n=1 Tax=Klebsiella aerogenes TaxID=548 RepID=A0AAP9QXF4_KLEAE|nr:winged helix-turn-helix domain-containing protein [Klebsiella aerogenes]EKM7810445.1 winged helix-turn-helix transcriptional regulator [Klebsiella aerogenes]EKU4512331.1 winged helix-turn-helix transcriptional regulator [Klebsiella aerogenes]EKU6671055.1 winged helix-turn-helix transcriptional regulator [Klebsiella aerogenes]EKU7553328.1 winged helix-turn-helix transcriptional regulator [Klebsiella aerogenes]EKV3451342.1 winged helix-turn-helix transcriptional regulator [Klebsiella aerogene